MELAMAGSQAMAVSVMEKLGDLVKMEAAIISSVMGELESLKSEMGTLMCFLKGAAEKEETDQWVLELGAEMEKTLDKADDIHDAFLLDVAHGKPIFSIFRSILSRFGSCLLGHSNKASLRKLTIIRDQIRAFNKNLESSGISKFISVEGVNLSRPDDLQPQLEGSGVGLKGDVEKLIPILVGLDQHHICSHIAIVGMGGIGKTTLAKSLLSDPRVRTLFEASAWVCVGRNFQTRKVFQDILLQLVPGCEEEINTFSNFQVLRQLYEVQLSNRFLIVLDDVWTKDDWTCLNLAFPSKKSTSKILVTTRCREVADRIADRGMAHRMRALTQDESWELFREKAFPGKYASNTLPFANQLNEIAHKIVEKCSGLPLAIVVIASLLGNKHTLQEWELVHQRMDWYARTELVSEGFLKIPRVLALTNYHDLPYYLKPCFLYLGLFPEDSEIDSQLLCQLWIAEGLISSTTVKRQTKMDVARCYLDELIKRNTVQVHGEKSPTSTRYKTILLHDLMRELCVSKGKEESFLKVMDCGSPKDQLKLSDPATPRLSLYSCKNEDRNVITLPSDSIHSLRSLFLFSCNQHPEDMALPSAVPSLMHLRSLLVLRFDGFRFGTGRSLKLIGELTRLTYLSLSGCFLDELPSSTGKLINLQTLDLRVQESTSIPNILWKMIRLRHLYLPHRFCVCRDEKLRLDSLKNLETLENFDTSLCNAHDLIKLPNLSHLGLTTEGNLGDPTIANNLSTKLKCLRQPSLYTRRSLNCHSDTGNSILGKLFECPTLYYFHIEGHISYLAQTISSSLTTLVFSGTKLDKDPMPALEKFPRLWTLELNNDVFLGKEMICSASGFPQLRHLKLFHLQYLENLSIEKGAMPNLSTLSIERCKRFKVLHDGFNHLRSLKKLKITKWQLEPSIGGREIK